MLRLPPRIAARYRPATGREVRSRSFGLVRAPRKIDATRWEQRQGTREDQAIFGPIRDDECACGKYQGPKHQNLICDRCGVKVTTRAARRQRFGHIDLRAPIVHPLGENGQSLDALPVLPAAFVESHAGKALAELYDELVRSALSESLKRLVDSFVRLLNSLRPVVIVAHDWDLQDAEVLACGLALSPRVISANDACVVCGYPLEGLEELVCPGCGRKL
jgi:hypothetical protein